MDGRGCGAGCLSTVGAFFLAVAVSALAEGGAGSLAGAMFLLACAGFPLWMAFSLVGSMRRDALARQELSRERAERVCLQVAARNGGRVTPTMVALNSAEVTVAEAKEILDRLARGGFCTMDSDDHGSVFYQFDLGQRPAEAGQVEPDRWVETMTRRMADSGASGLLDAEQ